MAGRLPKSRNNPQGLKAKIHLALISSAEAEPFRKQIMRSLARVTLSTSGD